VVTPALRLDVLDTRPFGEPQVPGDDPVPARRDAELSPRLGARWRVTGALTVKGNVGRYFRAPTLVELFGDRGFVVGNPELLPETGVTGDLGLVLSVQRPGFVRRLRLELATFASRPSNLIAFLPASGNVAIARNLADARLAGHEVAFAAVFRGGVGVSGNYTFLDTAQRSQLISFDGKQLPGRPRHEGYLRLDWETWAPHGFRIGAYVDGTWVDGNWLDAGNLNRVPTRRFLGAGLTLRFRDLALTLEGKNLLDETVEEIALSPPPRPDLDSIPRAVSDVLGYPLPGRAFYATLQWNP
jgi:iron complex outermembrane receptor protein